MNPKYIQVSVLATIFSLQFFFEHILPQRKELNSWKNERFNITIGLFNIVVTILPAYLMVQWVNFIGLRNIGLLNYIGIPRVLQIIVAIPILDLWMYTWHRFNHINGFLWFFHRFHHKDQKMNSTTALRFHFVELLLSYPGKALICFMFGINYLPLLMYECLFSTSVIFHHSNIRMTERSDKIYRALFVSPFMHRVHHSIIETERNNNYGALFSFWDRILKSWHKPVNSDIEFGINESGIETPS